MLAELAAANAAFGIIKQAVMNGREIAATGSAIAQFVGAKETLQKKAQKKGNGTDLEEFMALEQIRQREDELKQMMIILGRPGLWSDWQRYQAEARVARRNAEIAAKRKRRKIIEGTIIAFCLGLIVAVLVALAALILHHQGRL